MDGRFYVGQGSHLETVPHAEGEEPQSWTLHYENELLVVAPETLDIIEKKIYSHGRKTCCGAQNIETDGKVLYISFYSADGNDPDLVAYDKDLKPVRLMKADASNGIICTGVTNGVPQFLKCKTREGETGVSAEICSCGVSEIK